MFPLNMSMHLIILYEYFAYSHVSIAADNSPTKRQRVEPVPAPADRAGSVRRSHTPLRAPSRSYHSAVALEANAAGQRVIVPGTGPNGAAYLACLSCLFTHTCVMCVDNSPTKRSAIVGVIGVAAEGTARRSHTPMRAASRGRAPVPVPVPVAK